MPNALSPEFMDAAFQHVLEQIAEGRALTRILREDENMPGVSTFWRYCDDFPKRWEDVERAREIGAATILDEIVDIADESNGDVYVSHMPDGTAVAKIDGDAIQRAKLRVYAREKYAQMIAPRRFGTKVDVTSGGEKLPAPAVSNDNRIQTILNLAMERKREAEELKRIME